MLEQKEMVIVLDFGGQYTQLIARRIRECHVYCEILPYSTPVARLKAINPKGIVFSGGPSSVYAENAPVCDKEIFAAGIPILGICYGMQLMAQMLGGNVSRADNREYGKTLLQVLDADSPLFKGLPETLQVWMSHGDFVAAPPPGFKSIARTENTPVAALGNDEKKLYGVQFHPEVVHTPQGQRMLEFFLLDVCQCHADWTMESFVEQAVREIKEKVGDKKVLCALSGGVDSSVAAALVHKAVGDQLTCVFVDHGLLRKDEARQVIQTFRDQFHINLVAVDASARFLNKLKGVTDPEQKRKIIGNEFIRVFEEEARKLGEIDFLVQGTLYPDVVESGTDTAAVIKSHHNVGGLPEDMKFDLVEPLRWLFKDEVRQVGEQLGLPERIVWRQPFPGPGLAIRILGEITEEKLNILREADAILHEEIIKAGLYREIWQFFAVLPSMRSVGVMGDERTYSYTCVIRAVTSHDGMTADWARIPYDVLESVSSRIVNEVKDINRVVYDITSKPPATIEWE
ncbi:glutamine-hydrolyzing GMP synthase [Thermincola potens]|uniref:GMP synthase [glutamine-hydrolyzing] n=1 Tax=Thermincola potens (strain JR) TaxID=635013 RepID=D5XCM8_THEPJ|nr:glutamine-hydrolyzing GMP synthase [Thermincola potens]ADG81654.1 GMP synthase, large subunit [Thermincola potens JR]